MCSRRSDQSWKPGVGFTEHYFAGQQPEPKSLKPPPICRELLLRAYEVMMVHDMPPAINDLTSLRDRVRRGAFDEEGLRLGKQLMSRYQSRPNSKDYLQSLSLTAESAERLGRPEEAQRFLEKPIKPLLKKLYDTDIVHRFRRSNGIIHSDYELVRQEFWCILAYVQSCYNFRRFAEGIAILERLQYQIETAVSSPAWPQDLGFRGTRAWLHYYTGIMFRRSKPREALKHFRLAMDFIWERWELQRRIHKCDERRLALEYQYAIDSVARILSLGHAWTLLTEARLSEAGTVLRASELIARKSSDSTLRRGISLLLCHVRRHASGYSSSELKHVLTDLRDLAQTSQDHPVDWARAQFETGLVLIALLRSRDPEAVSVESRANHSRDLQQIIGELEKERRPSEPELRRERDFQVHWLHALQNEAEGRYLTAKDPSLAHQKFAIARSELKKLRNLYQALSEPANISPLQDWDSQVWVMPAAIEIQLGNSEAAQNLLDQGREKWKRGPLWLRSLARARYAAAAALNGEFAKADRQIELASSLARPGRNEVSWVADEIQRVREYVSEKRLAHESALKLVSVGAPFSQVREFARAVLQREFDEQHRLVLSLRKRGNENKWYQDEAAASLGCSSEQLRAWLSLSGLNYARQTGRPPLLIKERASKPSRKPVDFERLSKSVAK